MLLKLVMGNKFPRVALYSWKSSLGAVLMEPFTIADVLTLKLLVGDVRKRGNLANSMQYQ